MNKSAKEAYKGYIRAYDSHSLKDIFDINTLELISVAKSFGFTVPPFVDLREQFFKLLINQKTYDFSRFQKGEGIISRKVAKYGGIKTGMCENKEDAISSTVFP